MIDRYVRGFLNACRFLLHTLLAYWQFVLSFFRSPHQLVQSWPESGIVLGRRVALFVHYDRRGQVRPHVLRYVGMLQQCGQSVVFVTNSGRLLAESLAALKPLCAGILIRRNVGYDFGAWREALEFLALPRDDTESVLILNDSVYGPLRPLETLLQEVDFNRADVWGATDSWQARYHLQSYFLVAGRKVLISPVWHDFWRHVRPVQSKEWVIRRYEVGLTQSLMRSGFACSAMWRYTDLVRRVDPSLANAPGGEDAGRTDPRVAARASHAGRILHGVVSRRPLNPTSDLWRQLLQAGYPFLKRELLRENPTGVLDLADWRDEVALMKLRRTRLTLLNEPDWRGAVTNEVAREIQMIETDLKQTMRRRVP
jgi:hypothetical protein